MNNGFTNESELSVEPNAIEKELNLMDTQYATQSALNAEASVRLTNDNTLQGSINTAILDYNNKVNLINTNLSTINDEMPNKQDKLDFDLETASTTVVGAINELNGIIGTINNVDLTNKQDKLVDGNFTTIEDEKVNVNDEALGLQINTIQNSYSLNTESKTIVSAINELDANISNLDIAKQGTLIQTGNFTTITDNVINVNDNELGLKLNTLQNNYQLNTQSQTVSGAINELQNISGQLDSKIEEARTMIDGKQETMLDGNYTIINNGNQVNVTDDTLGTQINTVQNDYELTTTAQTIKGAVDELVFEVTGMNSAIESISSTLADKQTILNDGNYTIIAGNQVNVTDDTLGTQINTVQTGYGLLTTSQTIVGAINEVKGGGIDPSIYQLKTDDGLTTTDKTVVGAINEIKASGTDLSNYYDKPSTDGLLAGKQNILVNGNYTTITNGNQVDVADDALGAQINTVQTGYGLTTTAQTIKGAISELVTSVSGATSGIAGKQNINEPTLNTTSKTIPGGINEVVSSVSSLTTTVAGKQNTLSPTGNYITVSGNTVNVTDDALGAQIINVQNNYQLKTDAQTINGAIEELGDSIADNQTSIFSLTNSLNLKQNINEPTLNTTNKAVPGAINEVVSSVSSLTTTVAGKQNTLSPTGNYITVSGNTVNVTNSTLGTQLNTVQNNYGLTTTAQTIKGAIGELVTSVAGATSSIGGKQNINEPTLTTTSKTIPGGINEVVASVSNLTTMISGKLSSWTQVGTLVNEKSLTFNFVSGTRYRVRYNWENTPTPKTSITTANPIFKEFIFTGATTVLDVFLDGFSGVVVLGLTVLGSANVAQMILSGTGITISSKMGTSSAGNLIMLEQYSVL